MPTTLAPPLLTQGSLRQHFPMRKRWIVLFLFVAAVAVCSLAANLVLVFTRSWNLPTLTLPALMAGHDETKVPRFDQQPMLDGSLLDGKIAVLAIRGVIDDDTPGELGGSMTDDILYGLQQAAEDRHIRAVILKIDSPGGEVTASDTIFNAIKATTKKKPVVAYMGSMACSGAYYASVGADYLIANEATTTGSIGVIIHSMNYHGLLDKVGVEPLVFKSGAFKDVMSPSRPMTQIEKDYINLMVMQTFEKFLGIVAEQRHLPKVTLREQVGDGRILSAATRSPSGSSTARAASPTPWPRRANSPTRRARAWCATSRRSISSRRCTSSARPTAAACR